MNYGKRLIYNVLNIKFSLKNNIVNVELLESNSASRMLVANDDLEQPHCRKNTPNVIKFRLFIRTQEAPLEPDHT
ncbi:MAG: hypothetical protein R3E08_11120 [Thiotrichaceae bacterium]